MAALIARLRSFVSAFAGRRRVEREMEDEWRFHLESRIETLLAAGVERDEAERQARVQFGDPLRWKEGAREARGLGWVDDLRSDVTFGLRQLRRAPVFAATALCTLALGIGANTLAFSIVNSVLVRELPYEDPESIVMIWFVRPGAPDSRELATLQNYFTVRDRSRSFSIVGGSGTASASITSRPDDETGGDPVSGQRFFSSLGPVLGVSPLLGSWFTEADDPPGAARSVVLSYDLWQRHFAGDPKAIGQTVRMDGLDATVVGVMPEGFEFVDGTVGYWTASRWSEAALRSPTRIITIAARLREGVTAGQAQAEMDAIATALERELPETNDGWRIRVEPIHDAYTWSVRQPLLLLQGVVVVVLLIACANVIGLLLAQASARQREFAMRLALGSSRGRIVRQLVTESVLLAVAGGVVGLGLALAGLRIFMATNPTWLPRADSIALEGRVLAFAFAVSTTAGISVGLLTSWRVSRGTLVSSMRGVNDTGGTHHQRLRAALVTGQVALAVVLLIAAGLLVNTFVRLSLNRPGIDTANLLTFQVRLPRAEFVKDTGMDSAGFFTQEFSPRTSALFDAIQHRLSTVPGVQSVTASIEAPATMARFRLSVTPDGRPHDSESAAAPAGWFPVGFDYFTTLGTSVLRGRDFSASDTHESAQVAIVNETLARQLWPGVDPIGREVSIDFVNDPPRQVIGVVADVRETAEQRDFAPHVFVPTAQLPLRSRGWFLVPRITMTYLVRTATAPEALVPSLRSAVREVYGTQPIYNVRTMEQAVAGQLARWRQYLMLVGTFSTIAALLALVGVYGLIAYAVSQRTREIGVRRALGAGAGTVLRLVLAQGFRLTAVGIAAGVLLSIASTRVLANLLWGVSPTDPLTFVLVAAALTSAAFVACLVPARRALAISPLVALRGE